MNQTHPEPAQAACSVHGSIGSFDTVRTSARRILSRAGLLEPGFHTWRFLREAKPGLVVRNWRARRSQTAHDLPIPPASLIYSATGTRDVAHFLRSGQESAQAIRRSLEELGRPLETLSEVLDIGCGCGRVLRHWRGVRGPRFFGTDYNPAGVEWVREHLPFVTAGSNDLAPPLRYADHSFDLVYAISVFTHFPGEMQRPWLAELHRVLRPGGLLIITLCGEGWLSRLLDDERAKFGSGELVVIDDDYAGTNLCAAYHPDAYVHSVSAQWFNVLAKGRHHSGQPYQDQWVFARK